MPSSPVQLLHYEYSDIDVDDISCGSEVGMFNAMTNKGAEAEAMSVQKRGCRVRKMDFAALDDDAVDARRPLKRLRVVDDSMKGIEDDLVSPSAYDVHQDRALRILTPTPTAEPSSNSPIRSFTATSITSSSSLPSRPSSPSSVSASASSSCHNCPFSTGPGPSSHSFWLEDGDIVLGVEDVFFRIHSTRLTTHSTLFASSLNDSANGFGTEKVDGRPLIRLHGDNVKDWLVTLEAIYDPITFQIRPVLFEILTGALRISTKYDFRSLREWAIAQMHTTWPVNLDQMGPTALPHAAEAISLARQCNVPDILPAAFYALSIQKWRSGADGCRAHTVLAPNDFRRLVIGREALQDALVEIVASPLTLQGACAEINLDTNKDKARESDADVDIDVECGGGAPPRTCSAASTGCAITLPAFVFCSAPATCSSQLESFWRARLTPDASRAWGTWLMRELHRMATLPYACVEGPHTGTRGGHPSPIIKKSLQREFPIPGESVVGDSELPLVCVRCWEENRRLALWRLDWLKNAVPEMFNL